MNPVNQSTLSFSQMSSVRGFSYESSQMNEDLLFAHITPEVPLPVFERPVRIDGWMLSLCLRGVLQLEIDLHPCRLEPNSVACLGLDNIVRIHTESEKDFEGYILILSPSFMRNLNIDLNLINISSMAKAKTLRPEPMLLESTEFNRIKTICELIHSNVSGQGGDPTTYSLSIVRNLVAVVLYELMAVAQKASEEIPSAPDASRSRRTMYVHKFMHLLQEHHRQERSVSFYAGKLFISPKYLSLVIKETTGRSASQWIDEMVVLEAKNLLRFSGKNIQQVAYELNFSNQSTFGKYFKHLTGMSPSEYIKS